MHLPFYLVISEQKYFLSLFIYDLQEENKQNTASKKYYQVLYTLEWGTH